MLRAFALLPLLDSYKVRRGNAVIPVIGLHVQTAYSNAVFAFPLKLS